MPPARSRFVPWISLLLVALTLITFWPAVRFGFVNWDDMEHVAANPNISSPSLGALRHFWTTAYFGMWIPATYTLWQTTAALSSSSTGELNPAAFHALNLTLHAAATVLVFLILRRIVPGVWPAAFGAAVFAVHPIQVEAVVWVSGLRDVLGGAMSFLAIWLFLRAADSTGRARSGQYVTATAAFAIALLSKPTTAVTPLILAAILWRISARRRAAAHWLAPWFVMSAIDLTIAWFVQPSGDLYRTPIWARPLVAMDAIAFYLRKLLIPTNFLMDYGRGPEWLISHPSAWWSAGALFIAGAILIARRRQFTGLTTAANIAIVALLPVLGLVPFSFQYFSTVADRYVYEGMLGIAMAVALVATIVPPRLSWAPIVAIIAGLAIIAHRQVYVWQDTASLCNHTLAVNPDSIAALRIMTFESRSQSRWQTALDYNSRALQTKPGDGLLIFDRANILRDTGQLTEAIAAYAEAIGKRPSDPQIRNNYAISLAQEGQDAEAERQFAEVLRQAPQYAEARANWATYLALHGHPDQALIEFRRALADDPHCADAIRGIESLQAH